MQERLASCNCGSLTVRCRGEPVRISVCHCRACQRRTGSALSCNATFESDQVATEGPYRSFGRTGSDGLRSAYHFCPDCGSTAFYEIESRPGQVSVPVGAFADPGFPEPAISVAAATRHPWVAIRTSRALEEE